MIIHHRESDYQSSQVATLNEAELEESARGASKRLNMPYGARSPCGAAMPLHILVFKLRRSPVSSEHRVAEFSESRRLVLSLTRPTTQASM